MREAFDASGRRYVLREPGRSGGEGTVYAIDGMPTRVAKIYHPGRATAEARDKIEAMRAGPPRDAAWDAQRHRSIAWATDALYADRGGTRFAGFTMPAIDTRTFREAHALWDATDRIDRFGGAFTWRHLLGAAANLASAVAAIHAEGHRIGDLRETNVLVAPSALVSLIDCDSFQIRDPASGRIWYPRVGTGEYLPPELQHADFGRDVDRTHADRFALAVMIFKMLMGGVHPFQARGRRADGAPSTEAKIASGTFPYGRRRPGLEPPAYALPYDVLPPSMRALFRRCFVAGRRRPAQRPAPGEWLTTLKTEAERVRACSANPNHIFGGHLRACPWCAIAARGPDPFPAPGWVGAQRAVAAATPRKVKQAPAPPKPPPVAPPPRRSRVRTAMRMVTKRRAAFVLSLAAVLGLLASPVGHSAGVPEHRAIDWTARVTGSCPFEADRPAPGACRSRWRLGPAAEVTHRTRSLFLLVREHRHLVVPYRVRYEAGGACTLPWVDHLTFQRQAPRLCFGTCPERIELRGGGGQRGALIAVSGVGARSEPVRCGRTYRGSWTFDAAALGGRAALHFPAFEDVPIRLD